MNKGVVSVLTLVENDSWLCVVTRNERESTVTVSMFCFVTACHYYDVTRGQPPLIIVTNSCCRSAAPVLVCSVPNLLLITNLASLLQPCSVSALAVESSWAAFPGCQAPWCRVSKGPGYPGCLSSVSSGCRGSGDLCQPPLTSERPPPAITSPTRVTQQPPSSSSWPPGPQLPSKLLMLPQLRVSRLGQVRPVSCQVRQLPTCWPIPCLGRVVGPEVEV